MGRPANPCGPTARIRALFHYRRCWEAPQMARALGITHTREVTAALAWMVRSGELRRVPHARRRVRYIRVAS